MCAICGCGADHDHAHDDGHSHEHGHSHERGHSHDHDHGHSHGHSHVHAHNHEPDSSRPHEHAYGHRHAQPHARVHAHPNAIARDSRTVRFERELLAKNGRIAEDNRRDFARQRVAMFNLIGSPGAGKTALLEAVIPRLGFGLAAGVLEGDQATDNDARRIERVGARAVQINTGTGCHLDATMIASGVRTLAPRPESIVFVENVGNLVCPALFDLGERAKVVVMSVTEGEDKPIKYPHVFRAAKLFVLTKIDLQPLTRLDEDACFGFAREVNPEIRTMRVSARDGEGLDTLVDWIRDEAQRSFRAAPGEVSAP